MKPSVILIALCHLAILLYASCGKNQAIPPVQNTNTDKIRVVFCKKIETASDFDFEGKSRSAEFRGETWLEVDSSYSIITPEIYEIIEYQNGGKAVKSIAVPMCPYDGLIACFDSKEKPLFAVARKSCLKCIRISNFIVGEGGVIIVEGKEDFRNLIYFDKVELYNFLAGRIRP